MMYGIAISASRLWSNLQKLAFMKFHSIICGLVPASITAIVSSARQLSQVDSCQEMEEAGTPDILKGIRESALCQRNNQLTEFPG